MKNLMVIRVLFILFITYSLSSCEMRVEMEKENDYDRTDLSSVLNICKGHAIVVSKGYNEANFEGYRHILIIRDDSLNTYRYMGAEFQVSVGDTLK